MKDFEGLGEPLTITQSVPLSWQGNPDLLLPSSRKNLASRLYRAYGKRLLDIVLVLATAPVTVPVILVLALLVMRDGGRPFFGHRRIGRDGRTFKCWKVRSMVPDAEARLREYLAENEEARAEWATSFKLTHDPRITRLGNFLRKSNLDELPQLWNILKGEMSIVGPRPVTKDELKFYGERVSYYIRMSPGLTGPWQVSGRNDLAYHERVALDVDYARNCNVATDIRVIFATAMAVLKRTGR